jgi:hypothetical protein
MSYSFTVNCTISRAGTDQALPPVAILVLPAFHIAAGTATGSRA